MGICNKFVLSHRQAMCPMVSMPNYRRIAKGALQVLAVRLSRFPKLTCTALIGTLDLFLQFVLGIVVGAGGEGFFQNRARIS